ncbi:ABC-type transport system involved in cytochrome bd biosynthesis fused ATPase/permease subunit [Streptomyces sp. LBL]|uniref:hypothetical protein n=1 Tax=Streptomyces sp. LBL TaxID=2940562 RepID=UPI00247721D0|nr:hypothetical protein [Streptomyces sp. LBL]MDH6628257.1 ABC-type transport system involved in cytochrome bd biosynthesis fused ATPase/permease subunit [Streptomyces sp. LBL]
MMVAFLLIVLVAVALGIVGVAAHGLGFLLAVGVVLFIADVVFITVRGARGDHRRPIR